MGRGRHDTLGAPADHPAGARELAGGSSVSLVANSSSAKVVAVKDGKASAPNAGTACPEYTPTPLFAFDVQGAHVTVWPAQPSSNARNRAGEGGEEDDSNSDDASRNTRDSHISDSCGNDGIDCDNRIGDNSNCLNHIVYLHVYDGDGLDVLTECGNIGCPPFTLVAIKPACWNDDLTPWECPGLVCRRCPLCGTRSRTASLVGRRNHSPGRAGMRQTQQSPHLPHRRGLLACRAFRHLDSTQLVGLLPHRKRFGLALVSRFRALRCGKASSSARSIARISRLAARKRRPRADSCATLQRERTRSLPHFAARGHRRNSSRTPATTLKNPRFAWRAESPGQSASKRPIDKLDPAFLQQIVCAGERTRAQESRKIDQPRAMPKVARGACF